MRADTHPGARGRLDGVHLRTGLVLVLTLAVGVVLVGCAQQGTKDGVLTLTADEATLAPCPTAAPVLVESLRTTDLPTCEPIGQVLVFPDGEQVQLGEQAGGGGASSPGRGFTYVWESVGNWGLVAARVSDDCRQTREWGTPEAVRRVHDAFGADWACH